MDKNSYSQYVSLPYEIIEKHEKGLIGDAHFSDIIRAQLLSVYGGIWLDATILLTKQLPKDLSDRTFYTCKTYSESLPYFSKSRWTGFCLGGGKGYPLYPFLYEMLIAYWMQHDMAIDYLMMDYIFYIGYTTISVFHRDIDELKDNNLNRGLLMKNINSPFKEDFFKQLNEGGTFLQKLSWRYGKPVKRDKNHNLTNYGYLCMRYLDYG